MREACEFSSVEDFWRFWSFLPRPSEVFFDGNTRKEVEGKTIDGYSLFKKVRFFSSILRKQTQILYLLVGIGDSTGMGRSREPRRSRVHVPQDDDRGDGRLVLGKLGTGAHWRDYRRER
jgi:hypothetical protein